MKAKSALIASVAAVGIASTAQADSAVFNINTSWASTIADTNVTQALPDMASVQSIVITLAHTWGGDLDIYLNAPGGGTYDFDLFFSETATLPGPSTGNFSLGVLAEDGSLGNVGSYTFNAAGANNWTNPHSAPGTYNANALLAGAIAAGTWTFHYGDAISGDGGAIGTVTINYTAVPAPGALALLGLAGLVGSRRRRA